MNFYQNTLIRPKTILVLATILFGALVVAAAPAESAKKVSKNTYAGKPKLIQSVFEYTGKETADNIKLKVIAYTTPGTDRVQIQYRTKWYANARPSEMKAGNMRYKGTYRVGKRLVKKFAIAIWPDTRSIAKARVHVTGLGYLLSSRTSDILPEGMEDYRDPGFSISNTYNKKAPF